MKEKLLKQTAVCIMIAAALLVSKHSGISALERGADTVLAQMAVHYTAEDIKAVIKGGRESTAVIAGKVTDAVNVITGKPLYGEPIDEKEAGDRQNVHAVAGGQVTAVGENEEIGKYIKITHGAQGESLYGNLKTVSVQAPANVKKGQIIGTFTKKDGKDFYYSFTEF